jgi:hypothetical protein
MSMPDGSERLTMSMEWPDAPALSCVDGALLELLGLKH